MLRGVPNTTQLNSGVEADCSFLLAIGRRTYFVCFGPSQLDVVALTWLEEFLRNWYGGK
jgi:hypothetical protein